MNFRNILTGLIASAALAGLVSCGGGSGDGTVGTGLTPTLASIQANVFSESCVGCHTGGGASGGLRLDPGFSAVNLINVASPRDASLIRVVPGNPNASFLIQKLEGTQSLGDRMPQNGPYLPQSTINVVRQWIQDEALP